MSKFKVVINTPNRMILVNGKLTRTPMSAIVDEKNLLPIRAKIAQDGILNFSIDPYEKEETKPEVIKDSPPKQKRQAKTKKNSETTLDKILDDDTE